MKRFLKQLLLTAEEHCVLKHMLEILPYMPPADWPRHMNHLKALEPTDATMAAVLALCRAGVEAEFKAARDVDLPAERVARHAAVAAGCEKIERELRRWMAAGAKERQAAAAGKQNRPQRRGGV